MILVFRDNMKWKMCFTLALPLSIPNEDVVPLWCLKRFMKALKISIKSFEAPKRSAKIKSKVNFYFNTTFWNAKSFRSHDDQGTDTHFEVLPPNPSLSQEDKFSSKWKLLSKICIPKVRHCRNYNQKHFFCIHCFLYREFLSPTWKKSPLTKVPIPTQNPNLN